MSDLPQGWERVCISDVGELRYGKGLPTNRLSKEGYPVFGANGVIGFHDHFMYEDEQLLISCRGANSGAINISPKQCFVTNNSLVLELNSAGQGSRNFLKYALLAADRSKIVTGSAQPQVTIANASGFMLYFPPLPEQRRIVAKIDSLTGKSRRARNHLDHIPRLVEKYKQAILAAAFRGDLTREWRNSNEQKSGEWLRDNLLSARVVVEGGKRLPSFDFSGTEQLPQLPASWAWMPVNALATKIVDGVHKKPEYISSGIPFLTVKNLTAGQGISFQNCRYISESDHQDFIRRTHPEKGDILITKDGTLGVVRAIRTDVQFSIFVSLALVKPVDRSMTDYLELAFQSPSVQDQMAGVGSGLQHIHLTDLRKDFIPVAPESERHEIVRRVDLAIKWINRLAADATSAHKLIDHLDQSVLAKAFKGELAPQDPADEPAGALLDRIRAERSAAPKTKRGRKKAA